MKRIILAISLLLASLSGALAQSSPGLVTGQVPTAGQWNGYFAAKQDSLGYSPVNKAGDVMTGKLITAASTTIQAGLNLPAGTAPVSPINGDMWTTSAGLFIRINGVTVGPLVGAGSGTFAATAPLAVTFPASVVTYAITGTAGAVLGGSGATFTATPTLGVAGTTLGTLSFQNITSGSITLQPVTGALGSSILSLPAATDTLLGRATTDTLTNKTFNTGGTGNSFSIAGVAVTANTGTGAVARAVSASLTTPTISGGSATALTALGIRSSGTGAFDIRFTNTENLTAQRSLIFQLNDADRLLALGGNLATSAAISQLGAFPIIIRSTASTDITLPISGTLATLTGSETFTNKTLTSPTINAGALSGTFSGTPTFSGANFITIANLAQSTTGFSLLGNTAAGTSNYANFTIGGLTNKVSPASTDILLLQDQAASGALKFCTLAQCIAAVSSGVTTFNSRSGAVVPTLGDYTAALVNYTATGTGGFAQTQGAYNGRVIWTSDYGPPACDGVTDDATNIQNAANAAIANKVPLGIQASALGCRIATTLTITAPIKIFGVDNVRSCLVLGTLTMDGIVYSAGNNLGTDQTTGAVFEDFCIRAPLTGLGWADIAAGGSGYTNGTQTLTITGGTCATAPQISVTVAGNVVTKVLSVVTVGTCAVQPSRPASTSGGGGTGATFYITWKGNQTAGNGILFDAGGGKISNNNHLSRMRFNGLSTGVNSVNAGTSEIDHSVFDMNIADVLLQNTTSNDWVGWNVHHNRFTWTAANAAANIHVNVASGSEHSINENWFFGGLWQINVSPPASTATGETHIQGNFFETAGFPFSPSSSAIANIRYFVPSGPTTYGQVIIKGNEVSPSYIPTTGSSYGIILAGSSGSTFRTIVIDGNTINLADNGATGTLTGIDFDFVDNINVLGNTIKSFSSTATITGIHGGSNATKVNFGPNTFSGTFTNKHVNSVAVGSYTFNSNCQIGAANITTSSVLGVVFAGTSTVTYATAFDAAFPVTLVGGPATGSNNPISLGINGTPGASSAGVLAIGATNASHSFFYNACGMMD